MLDCCSGVGATLNRIFMFSIKFSTDFLILAHVGEPCGGGVKGMPFPCNILRVLSLERMRKTKPCGRGMSVGTFGKRREANLQRIIFTVLR